MRPLQCRVFKIRLKKVRNIVAFCMPSPVKASQSQHRVSSAAPAELRYTKVLSILLPVRPFPDARFVHLRIAL